MNNTILWFRSPFQHLPDVFQERLELLLPRKEEPLIDLSTESDKMIPYTAWNTDKLPGEWLFIDITPGAGLSPVRLMPLFNIKAIMTFVEELDREHYPVNYEIFENAQWLYITEIRATALKLNLPLIIFFMSRITEVVRVETINIHLPFTTMENLKDFTEILNYLT